jgi:hypothetical protein
VVSTPSERDAVHGHVIHNLRMYYDTSDGLCIMLFIELILTLTETGIMGISKEAPNMLRWMVYHNITVPRGRSYQ